MAHAQAVVPRLAPTYMRADSTAPLRRDLSAASAQRFLDAFSRVCNLFRPGRHQLTAAAYRATMHGRIATWREVARVRVVEQRGLDLPRTRVVPALVM